MDILDDDTLAEAGHQIAREGVLDLLIVATGLLHRGTDIRPEKSLRQFDGSVIGEIFAVNSVGPSLVAKQFFHRSPGGSGRSPNFFLRAVVGLQKKGLSDGTATGPQRRHSVPWCAASR